MNVSIISDEDLEEAFKNTNFGNVDHRKLLEASVLKKAMGLHCGHTITRIMQDWGLISSVDGRVLKKGQILLYEAFRHLVKNGG